MKFHPVLGALLLVSGAVTSADHSGAVRRKLDLLPMVDLRHDRVHGSWELKDGVLRCTLEEPAARVMIPYLPPEEYDLIVTAERTEGKDAFVMGLASGDAQFVHVLDGYTAEGKCLSGFETLDGLLARSNESTREGQRFANGTPSVLSYSVRRRRVTVAVNGERVLDWKGDFKRLSVRPDYRINNAGVLFVGAYNSRYRITRVSLYPVGLLGRTLRDK